MTTGDGAEMEPVEGGVAVELLDLDGENPRLPEEMQGASQAEILAYLEENDVLDELFDSYLANGFFPNEPILVLPPDNDGRRVVVEGNRRLAALMILLQLPPASNAGLPFDRDPVPTQDQLDRLRRVPAVEVRDRAEVDQYLGFRHISGLKTWEPEAKARYLWQKVEEAVVRGSTEPFYEVGRRVGSNAFGVRNAYNAFNILRAARDDFGLGDEVQYVLRNKFGVWSRLLGTAHVPDFIGASSSGVTYAELKADSPTRSDDRLPALLRRDIGVPISADKHMSVTLHEPGYSPPMRTACAASPDRCAWPCAYSRLLAWQGSRSAGGIVPTEEPAWCPPSHSRYRAGRSGDRCARACARR